MPDPKNKRPSESEPIVRLDDESVAVIEALKKASPVLALVSSRKKIISIALGLLQDRVNGNDKNAKRYGI